MRLEWYEKLALAALALLIPIVVYLLFVIIPVRLYTEAECLRNGYPRSYVSVGLERYCGNLEGVVTISIKKQ